jgi:6-phosphogluconolactonase (cycloisomerase 2 family)
MRNFPTKIMAFFVLCGLAPASLYSQQYLYTNDFMPGTNTTTALSVSKAGVVKPIETYSTGGPSQTGGALFAMTEIASAQTKSNRCLFVANGGNGTIAAFTIDFANGKLKSVHGSPFSYGVGGQSDGMSLAVGDNQLLFVGNTTNLEISVLRISPSCALKAVSTASTGGNTPVAMKVTPNGKYLIAGYFDPVDSFSIDYKAGKLTEIGPFNSQGSAADPDISCDSSTVYFGDAAANTQVEVFSINSTGQLTEINNFTNNNGQNSNFALLSRNGKYLYVSNTMSFQVTTLSVGANGALTYDSTTSLNNPGGTGQYALGLAIGESGADLFVEEVNSPESIGSLAMKGDTLKEVTGSPFPVVNNSYNSASFVAVPPKSCK